VFSRIIAVKPHRESRAERRKNKLVEPIGRRVIGLSQQQTMKKLVSAFALCLFLIWQTGCTLFGNSGLDSGAEYGPLHLGFSADRARVKVGESVKMRFGVRNNGNETFTIESKDTPVMDIIAEVVGGPELLTWSSQNPDKISHRMEWKPGESKVIELTWTARQEDVYVGTRHDIYLTGLLSSNSKLIKAAGVRICASNVCR